MARRCRVPSRLRRAIPLDLFPTDVVASSLVQKTYSPNFPGEFGGGVINLTTLAVPTAPFLSVNLGGSYDSETTDQLGYDYYGGKRDWSGYDNGNRDLPDSLKSFLASGNTMSSGNVDSGAIAGDLVNWRNGAVQKIDSLPANYSGAITGGNAWMLGESRLGVIATAGFSNKWRTRDNVEQSPGNFDLSLIDKDYRRVASENRAVTNALVGVGYEFGEGNKLRWTNVYIHDTLEAHESCGRSAEQSAPGRGLSRADDRLVRAAAARHAAHWRIQARSGDARRPRLVLEVQARSAVRAGTGVYPHQSGEQPVWRVLHQSAG